MAKSQWVFKIISLDGNLNALDKRFDVTQTWSVN